MYFTPFGPLKTLRIPSNNKMSAFICMCNDVMYTLFQSICPRHSINSSIALSMCTQIRESFCSFSEHFLLYAFVHNEIYNVDNFVCCLETQEEISIFYKYNTNEYLSMNLCYLPISQSRCCFWALPVINIGSSYNCIL